MSKVVIRNGKIIEDEATVAKPSDTVANGDREYQKKNYRKDLLQKNQVDYYRAYPEQAKELNPELRRLLS